MNKQEKIISLARRRGFIFPSSLIYGGFAGVYDYGPIGVEMKNNIKNMWWRNMVQCREDIVGLDSAIFAAPQVWDASGHTNSFSDPMIYCKKTGEKFRLDNLLEEKGIEFNEHATKEEFQNLLEANKEKLDFKDCEFKDLSEVTKFNLLVESNLGNIRADKHVVSYLRGETCQGIYINYQNVVDSIHPQIPFGIAQIGKAFRNEISPRNYIFRLREFEQMEMQYFIHPDNQKEVFDYFLEYRKNFLVGIGLKEENLKLERHKNLIFYAKDAVDIQYKYSFGFGELEGIHNRGDYDLTQHSKHSNEKLVYRNQITNEVFTPCVIETSIGLDRLYLALLNEAYTEETLEDGTERTVLKLHKDIAPIYIAVLPLFKKGEMTTQAREVFQTLNKHFRVLYDETQSIGKRYRRQDEIGTPYCVTIDYETNQDDSVTVRDRDTMKQKRVEIPRLIDYFNNLSSSSK